MEHLTLRVVNKGDDDLRLLFEHEWYVIPAGSERWVPRLAVNVWFGDPDARDVDMGHRPRFDEWLRLQGTYNDFTESGERFFRFPQVEVWDADGNRVLTVLDDPFGEHLGPVETEGLQSDAALLQRQIDEMSRTLESLQRARDSIVLSSDVAVDHQPDIPVAADDGGAVAVGEELPVDNPPIVAGGGGVGGTAGSSGRRRR